MHFGEGLLTYLVFEGKFKTNVVMYRMLRMEQFLRIFAAAFLCLLRFKKKRGRAPTISMRRELPHDRILPFLPSIFFIKSKGPLINYIKIHNLCDEITAGDSSNDSNKKSIVSESFLLQPQKAYCGKIQCSNQSLSKCLEHILTA